MLINLFHFKLFFRLLFGILNRLPSYVRAANAIFELKLSEFIMNRLHIRRNQPIMLALNIGSSPLAILLEHSAGLDPSLGGRELVGGRIHAAGEV